MATPSYKGNGQPQSDSGFWSGFGSWFGGGSTPAYAGAGKSSSASSGFFGSGTPAYKPAPSGGPSQSQSVGVTRAIDPASPRIAIVVPRDLFPCDVTDPQQ